MNVIVLMGAPCDVKGQMKDLEEINRTTILEHTYNTLQTLDNPKFTYVVRKEDVNRWHIDNIIRLLEPKANIIIANNTTKGAVCTALLAIDSIQPNEPLILTGGNQIVLERLQTVVDTFIAQDVDAGTIIFEDVHPRWSYFKVDEQTGLVMEAAEKNPISKNASTGFYYYKKGGDFIEAAQKMLLKDIQVNGSYYISLCINEMILAQKKVGVYPIKKEQYYNLNHAKGIEAFTKYFE